MVAGYGHFVFYRYSIFSFHLREIEIEKSREQRRKNVWFLEVVFSLSRILDFSIYLIPVFPIYRFRVAKWKEKNTKTRKGEMAASDHHSKILSIIERSLWLWGMYEYVFTSCWNLNVKFDTSCRVGFTFSACFLFNIFSLFFKETFIYLQQLFEGYEGDRAWQNYWPY